MKELDVVKLKTDDKKLGLTTENRGAIVDELVPGKVSLFRKTGNACLMMIVQNTVIFWAPVWHTSMIQNEF